MYLWVFFLKLGPNIFQCNVLEVNAAVCLFHIFIIYRVSKPDLRFRRSFSELNLSVLTEIRRIRVGFYFQTSLKKKWESRRIFTRWLIIRKMSKLRCFNLYPKFRKKLLFSSWKWHYHDHIGHINKSHIFFTLNIWPCPYHDPYHMGHMGDFSHKSATGRHTSVFWRSLRKEFCP